jgi:hypothetical protein
MNKALRILLVTAAVIAACAAIVMLAASPPMPVRAAFTIPDKGEGDSNIQSILFQEDVDVLVAGISSTDCALSGLAITGGADMTPAVAKGSVLSNGTMFAVAAGDVTVGAADGTNPRIDLIVISSSGAKAVRAGTAAAAPKPPARTANDVVIGQVYVPASDTTIGSSQIIDKRVFCPRPTVIYKTVAAETTDTTAAAIEALNKANSGVTIPDGLFLSGRILRVRLVGNYLVNSGTPTIRIVVAYGGTTMFSHISTALVADADRGAFNIMFNVVAQGNSDQAMVGHVQMTDPDLIRPTPTTGIGDIWTQAGTAEGDAAMAGSAAVDSNAANRLLSVQWTFSVSNAANQLVVEGASVELL